MTDTPTLDARESYILVAAAIIGKLKIKDFKQSFLTMLSSMEGALEWTPGQPEHLPALARLAKRARDDLSCDEMMRVTAVTALQSGHPLPSCVKEYVIDRLYNAQPKMKAKNKYFHRDYNILLLLYFAYDSLPFDVTRNDKKSHDSCCDLVVEAMAKTGWHVTYDVVKKVWSSRLKSGLEDQFTQILDAAIAREQLSEKELEFCRQIKAFSQKSVRKHKL